MTMTDHHEYHLYLRRRRWTGRLYIRHLLYPRLASLLTGQVLDVGCGTGDFLAFRPGTVGVDVNPYNVRHCRERGLRVELLQPDTDYPFADASFDGAVMDNVLEHLVDPDPTVSEIHRVLRPQGTFVVGVPGHRGYAPICAQYIHEREYCHCPGRNQHLECWRRRRHAGVTATGS